jgi:lipase
VSRRTRDAGPPAAVHRIEGPLRPIVLLPATGWDDAGWDDTGWDDVAPRLAAAGHEVAQLPAPADPGDTDRTADDVAALLDLLGYTGGRSPVLAGHGWGASVAMSLAARRNGIAGLACIDGGWLRPARQFASLTDYLTATAATDGVSRAQHTALFQDEPRAWYPLVRVPVLLAPALPAPGEPGAQQAAAATRAGVAEAAAGLVDHRISWYDGAGPSLPRTAAARLADDLLHLTAATEPAA